MVQAKLINRMIAPALLFSAFSPAVFAIDTNVENEVSRPETRNMVQGEWTFETELYRSERCKMSGSLSVFAPRGDTENSLPCALNAVEVCGEDRSIVEQMCTISFIDGTVFIESEIMNLLEEKPWSAGYAPDNFKLDEVTPVKMSGSLVSAVTAPVVFERKEGGIS